MKTKQLILLMSFLTILFTGTSCLDEYIVNGNHASISEDRYVSHFDRVSSGGSFLVTIVPGDEYSVQVTAESNLLNYIETEVVNNKLRIKTRSFYNIHNHLPMEVFVTTPNLSSVALSGSGRITTGEFESSSFNVDISGSGKIETTVFTNDFDCDISGSGRLYVDGTAEVSSLKISGSGEMHAYDLVQEACHAVISGSGSMYLTVNHALDVAISGSGNVFYQGFPTIHSNISGSGKVVDRN